MINLIIVEPHHHVLEHIHYTLRQQARKIKDGSSLKWSLLHWDSHPDLACPNEGIPALACFLPRKTWLREEKESVQVVEEEEESLAMQHVQEKNLYDLLDTSEGGIAEWILPLVLAGGLNRMIWMKNSWCSQFSNGRHSFHVGIAMHDGSENKVETFLDLPESAIVKSSFSHPYYLDDKSFERLENLQLPQELELLVLETTHLLSTEDREEYPEQVLKKCHPEQGLVNPTDWILDVCLDYFVCSNPFLDELNAINTSVSQNFKIALTETSFRIEIDCSGTLDVHQASAYSKSLEEFNLTVHTLLNKLIGAPDRDYTKGLDVVSVQDEISTLEGFYGDTSYGRCYWTNVIESLDEVCRKDASTVQPLILAMSKAVENISLPYFVTQEDIHRDQSALPQYVEEKIQSFGHCLRQKSWLKKELDFNEHPLLITIARSSDDGYTPSWVVERLQDAVLNEIHDAYCGCVCRESDKCEIRITLDYGLNEGSSLERLRF
jgi:hypothetical protein